jgi:hypothetical protein
MDLTGSKVNSPVRHSLPGLTSSIKPTHEMLDGILTRTTLLAAKEAKPSGPAPKTAFTQYAMGSVPYTGSHSYTSGRK